MIIYASRHLESASARAEVRKCFHLNIARPSMTKAFRTASQVVFTNRVQLVHLRNTIKMVRRLLNLEDCN